jgi:DNA-directed RNA polymerase specialized sigma24 family protein
VEDAGDPARVPAPSAGLRFYLDLRIENIADLLGLPVGTVKSRMHHGLAALGKEITS